MNIYSIVSIFFVCFGSLLSAAKTEKILLEEFIFPEGKFPSCHASTLTETLSGEILCAWFAGKEEGANDVAIWMSTLKEGTWSPPKQVASVPNIPSWNPVLYTMPSGEVLLFYKAGRNPQQWSGYLKRSIDDGKTWSSPIDLPAGVFGPVRNRPLLLSNGTLLCGSSTESFKRWGCWIDITHDGGKSWEKSRPINVETELFGIIQPALFTTKKGSIQLLARSHQIGFICQSESFDEGKTWTDAKPTSLPNPNSAIDAISLTDGQIALVYNHSSTERYPLNVALSSDDGKTWQSLVTLEEKPGEFSYPCIFQSKKGDIHITYTWNRKKIKHVVLRSVD